jgi:hypothetical protein
MTNKPKSSKKKPQKRHKFFLNPYSDCAFTKCPKCDLPTKVRKYPLVIHVEPKQVLLLNKKCKYCPSCDLIIAKKQEIESFLAFSLNRQLNSDDYLVMGTIDRQDWVQGNKGAIPSSEIFDRMYVFKTVWDFEVIPAGWYPNEN